jgi:hypothetical protein
MQFDAASIQTEIIKEDADYQGVRARFNGELNGARVVVQLDIGFSDAVVPGATRADFPTLLDLPAPNLLCYSRESAIAEKFEAMVKLSNLNSRMKDFYDIWLLARQFEFEQAILAEAINQTFTRRGTPKPEVLPFTAEFVAMKELQWRAFHKRLSAAHVPQSLSDITVTLREFLMPFIRTDQPLEARYWQPNGPWRPQYNGELYLGR